MFLSSELFVMVIFIIGVPLMIITLRDSHLPENRLFITAYIFLVFSNLFTVIEEVMFNTLFNFLEHLFITIASIIILVAVSRLTSRKNSSFFADSGSMLKK